MRPCTAVILSKEQRRQLEANIKPTAQYRFVQRIKAILLAAEGKNNKQIARKVGLSVVAISRWRNRFVKYGVEGLKDLPRPGKPAKYGHSERLRMVDIACQPPSIKTRWTLRELGREDWHKQIAAAQDYA